MGSWKSLGHSLASLVRFLWTVGVILEDKSDLTLFLAFLLFGFFGTEGLSFHLLGVFKDLRVDSESEEKFADCVSERRM